MKFRRNIFGKFANIQIPVRHYDSHKGGGQEIGHIVVDRRQLVDFGLIFGVYGIKLLVDALQLLIGTLQFFIGRQELLVGCLQLRVDALELRHGLSEAVLRYVQVFLQIRDPL